MLNPDFMIGSLLLAVLTLEACRFLHKELSAWHHADNERTVEGKKKTSRRTASGCLQIFPA